jgi:protease-4
MSEENKNGFSPITEQSADSSGKKASRTGCIVLAIISIAALSAVCIIAGLFIIVIGIFGGGDGGFSEKLKPFPRGNDGLTEKFIQGKSFSSNKIALIEIKGVIMEGNGGGFTQAADSSIICKQMGKAIDDPSVKAVILFLDTPGGEVTAADNIYEKVLELRKKGKIVVSYMNSVAASGGYYVAVASNHIVAHRLCITGSIGVIMQTYNYRNLLDKIGVHTETYKSGPMKDMLDGSRLRTEEEKVLAQDIINKIYGEFVDIVAAGRKDLSAEKIKTSEIGDGRIFLGSDALKLGMVDENGFFDDAVFAALEIANITGDDYKMVSYQKIFTFSEIFSQMNSPEQKISLNLGAGKQWNSIIEPGKPYFLPAR